MPTYKVFFQNPQGGRFRELMLEPDEKIATVKDKLGQRYDIRLTYHGRQLRHESTLSAEYVPINTGNAVIQVWAIWQTTPSVVISNGPLITFPSAASSNTPAPLTSGQQIDESDAQRDASSGVILSNVSNRAEAGEGRSPGRMRATTLSQDR